MIATTMQELHKFKQDHERWLFRGCRSPKWKYDTSLERAARRCGAKPSEYERAIWDEFRRHATGYTPHVPPIQETFQWLGFMQHYGAPTRLLHFTLSFWVALFFAFEAADDDCSILALEKNSLAPNETGKDYNEILRLNIERGIAKDASVYSNVAFFTNQRLAIQQGTFVFSLDVDAPFDTLIRKAKIDVLEVKANLFPEIRKFLNEVNCNRRTLFPGIDGYAQSFANHTW